MIVIFAGWGLLYSTGTFKSFRLFSGREQHGSDQWLLNGGETSAGTSILDLVKLRMLKGLRLKR